MDSECLIAYLTNLISNMLALWKDRAGPMVGILCPILKLEMPHARFQNMYIVLVR